MLIKYTISPILACFHDYSTEKNILHILWCLKISDVGWLSGDLFVQNRRKSMFFQTCLYQKIPDSNNFY